MINNKIKFIFVLSLISAATVLSIIVFFRRTDSTDNAAVKVESTQNQAPKPTTETRCVIVIDSQSYDVSTFKTQHEGGDIFVCGTDMSAVFHGQHPAGFLKKIEIYKI